MKRRQFRPDADLLHHALAKIARRSTRARPGRREQEEPERAPADAALIAAARNALPALIAAARERDELDETVDEVVAQRNISAEAERERTAERDALAAQVAAVEAVAADFDTAIGFRGAATAIRAALADPSAAGE